MNSDAEIKINVEAELQWDPNIMANDIGVNVRNGVVSLSGYTSSYGQKFHAENDAKRINGVVGVANDIQVRLLEDDHKSDPEIARNASTALKVQLPNSHQSFQVIVRQGWVTLEGSTEWQYLKERAEGIVRHLAGINGVINKVTVDPKVSPAEIKHKIEAAFKRSAEIDANRITVEAINDEVILKGTVHTWFERREAERVAWLAPGVRNVDDRIQVQP